ncbi:tetratricopeptide repeat protein [Actinophytocola glycyrrhizae]|uniref:Tetratricopeptide repeat protein n=1 Tax=Actinophytocola glycyrrhizae TaxID=2044873 RepID=A0ABV9S5Z6_9PSEU
MSTRRERRLVDRYELARSLHEVGRLSEAEAEYRAVLSARVKRGEPFHPETLAAWQQLALLIAVDGRADEAAGIAATTIESYAREYGLNHPETLQSRVSLALVRFTQGRFADAAALHTSVLLERERSLGTAVPATVESRRYLAGTLARLGRADEAEDLLRVNIADAPDPHQQFEARTVLADLLFQLDRLPAALTEFTSVADAARHGPIALVARQGRAGVLFALGRFAEALELYRSLEFASGDQNNYLVRASIEHLRAAMGDADGAVVELRSLLATARERWGPRSPLVRATLLVLGDVLLMADQPSAAVEVFDDAIDALRRTGGPRDSMTLCARHMLGVALVRVGQLDEAEQEFLAAADRDDRPRSHSCALAIQQGLARIAAARGEFAAAATAQAAVVSGLTSLYGPDHPNTLEARFDAANLLRHRAYPAEAAARHREILAARTRVLGEDHPDTRKSRAALR